VGDNEWIVCSVVVVVLSGRESCAQRTVLVAVGVIFLSNRSVCESSRCPNRMID